jgi:hypothetical protein
MDSDRVLVMSEGKVSGFRLCSVVWLDERRLGRGKEGDERDA